MKFGHYKVHSYTNDYFVQKNQKSLEKKIASTFCVMTAV